MRRRRTTATETAPGAEALVDAGDDAQGAPHGRTPEDGGTVVRNNAATRSFHAATALTSLVLLATGWWLARGGEGRPSPLAAVLDAPDTEVHRTAGWALTGVVAAGLTLGARAAWTFTRETVRLDRGDLRWLRGLPAGARTGRFARHRGHFDPGQRLANLAFVTSLGVLIGSGIALTTLTGGPTFAAMVRVHRAATYVLTGTVVVHLVVVSGILPGYRGVWRAMVGRGRVPGPTARRLWPDHPAGAAGPSPSDRSPERERADL